MTSTPPESAHRIRLRRPWDRNSLPAGTSKRIDVPETGLPDEVIASDITLIEYRRAFQCPPAVLDSDVWLHISNWTGDMTELLLNDAPLELTAATPQGVSWLVSQHLESSNEIVLRLRPAPIARLNGEVNLLIAESHQNSPSVDARPKY